MFSLSAKSHFIRLLLLLARSIFFNEIYHTISLIYVVIKRQIEIDRIYIFSAIQVQNRHFSNRSESYLLNPKLKKRCNSFDQELYNT